MAWVNLSGAFGYGTILTSTQMQNLRDNIAAAFAKDGGAPVLANDYVLQAMITEGENPGIGTVKYGVYTGDGTTDQDISGVGFTPRAVLVVSQTDNSVKSAFLAITGLSAGLSIDLATGFLSNVAIISIDADGFSVSDGAGDDHPNKAAGSHGYVYWAWS